MQNVFGGIKEAKKGMFGKPYLAWGQCYESYTRSVRFIHSYF